MESCWNLFSSFSIYFRGDIAKWVIVAMIRPIKRLLIPSWQVFKVKRNVFFCWDRKGLQHRIYFSTSEWKNRANCFSVFLVWFPRTATRYPSPLSCLSLMPRVICRWNYFSTTSFFPSSAKPPRNAWKNEIDETNSATNPRKNRKGRPADRIASPSSERGRSRKWSSVGDRAPWLRIRLLKWHDFDPKKSIGDRVPSRDEKCRGKICQKICGRLYSIWEENLSLCSEFFWINCLLLN